MHGHGRSLACLGHSPTGVQWLPPNYPGSPSKQRLGTSNPGGRTNLAKPRQRRTKSLEIGERFELGMVHP